MHACMQCLEAEARDTLLTKLAEKDIKVQERVETA